jgi:hypothetical protein
MFLARLKSVLVVSLLIGALRAGAGVVLHQGPAQTAPAELPAAASPAAAERVYRHLFTRTDQDGKPYDQEELEPPFAPDSKFLTDGTSHTRALAVLDDFLSGRAEKSMTPLQRAVLQHDLWAVLATTAGAMREEIQVDEIRGQVRANHARFEDQGDADLERLRQRRALQKRLVAAMRRLALGRREIDALPDNLADAVMSAAFPREFDPKRPEQAFLPPDLARADGGWVGMANGSAPAGLAAPAHTAFVKGRSVFTVHLRLPAGREATQAYLKKAANGDVGQFPEGTQTALVRRMLLIDDSGALRPTALTESVELRFFRKPERGTDPLDMGAPAVWILRRQDLLAGRNGGLRAVGRDETTLFSFQARFGHLGMDQLERPRRPRADRLLGTCMNCHARTDGSAGVWSVATLYAGETQSPRGLVGVTDQAQAEATMRWLRKTYTWGLVQGLWETPPSGD